MHDSQVLHGSNPSYLGLEATGDASSALCSERSAWHSAADQSPLLLARSMAVCVSVSGAVEGWLWWCLGVELTGCFTQSLCDRMQGLCWE
jgi:hypothetical protein